MKRKTPQTGYHRDEATLRVLAGDWTCQVCGFWEEGYAPITLNAPIRWDVRPTKKDQLRVCRLCWRSYSRIYQKFDDWLEQRKAWVEKQRALGWPGRRHFKEGER